MYYIEPYIKDWYVLIGIYYPLYIIENTLSILIHIHTYIHTYVYIIHIIICMYIYTYVQSIPNKSVIVIRKESNREKGAIEKMGR